MFTENRELPVFNKVWLKGIGNVIVQKSDVQEVRITSNQNIISRIKTKVVNGELIISVKDAIPFWMAGLPKLDIYLSMEDINRLRISGVGRIRSEEKIIEDEIELINSGVGGLYLHIESDHIRTELKGVGEIELSGKTKTHDVHISGTGKVGAYNLESESTDIVTSGVGECVVWATSKLHVTSSGIEKIRYRGNPKVTGSQTGLGGIEAIP